jgi:hypothetical protein
VSFYRGQFWSWNGTRWASVPDAEQRADLARFCKRQLDRDAAAQAAEVPKVTTGLVSNVPRACQEDAEQIRADANPARRFLLEGYEEGDGEIRVDDLYAAYANWSRQQGHHPLSIIGFGREVARRFKQVRKERKGSAGARYFAYCGLVQRAD